MANEGNATVKMERIASGTARCEATVHRKPYTQADRGPCARWASVRFERAGRAWHLCAQHAKGVVPKTFAKLRDGERARMMKL